jgi:hypothetical protein
LLSEGRDGERQESTGQHGWAHGGGTQGAGVRFRGGCCCALYRRAEATSMS